MARYLITGAAGFIGSHLVETLSDRPDTDVVAIDNFCTGNIENIAPFLDKIRFIRGDITVPSELKPAMAGVDYVLHQAALPSVPRSIMDPEASNRNNIDGTLNVLIAARDAGVKRMIFASSSSVYGIDPTLPKHENLPTIPKSPYALTKLAGEHYCRIFTEVFGLETVALRYFNVFGPRQNPGSQYSAVIPLFISTLLQQKSPVIHGDGTQTRDFTYVANVVSANLRACTAAGVSGQAFNIGCGSQTSIMELFSMILDELDVEGRAIHTDRRPGDVTHSCADIGKAQSMLGYHPAINLREGLKKTIRYYSGNVLKDR